MFKGLNPVIGKVFDLGRSFINQKTSQYGISSGLYFFIIQLSLHKQLTLHELSKLVGVDKAYTTRAVNKLIKLGLAKKTDNLTDGRSSLVSLTDKGMNVAKEIKGIMSEWIEIITKDISEEEMALFSSIYKRFYNNARRYFESERKLT